MTSVFFQTSPEFIRSVTLLIFLTVYLGIAVGHACFLRLDRTGIAMLGSIAMLATGCLSLTEAVRAVNMESILLLFSLMVIASQLHYSGLYQLLADRLARTLDRPALFLALLMGAAGLLSSVLNNDVVCLAFTPVATDALLRRRLNPIPYLIGLALASNIGCALTLIGSAQNVVLGQLVHLSFIRYTAFAALPVLLSLGAAYGIVLFLGRVHRAEPAFVEMPSPSDAPIPFNTWRAIKGVGILVILVMLFLATPLPRYLIALTAAGLLLCSRRLESRKVLALVDWQLLVLFIGLFVVVGAFILRGFGEDLMTTLIRHGIRLDHPAVLTAVTAALSNLINNSAAVMLLVNVVEPGDPVAAAVIAMANAFAGNLLLIGSLANVITAQAAGERNIRITFREFARYGIPVALVSLLIMLGTLPLTLRILN